MNNKFHNYKFCTTIKLKTYLYSKGHPTNIIKERVSVNLIFPITPIGYNSLKGYIS